MISKLKLIAWVAIVCFAVSMAIIPIGCAKAEEVAEEEVAEEEVAEEAEEEAEEVAEEAEEEVEEAVETATYWIEKAGLKPSGELNIYSYKDEMALEESVTSMFLDAFPEVQVNWVAVPYADYASKIALELETGTADFDIMWSWGAWTNQFKDYLMDVTDRIPQELKDDIVPGIHKAVGSGDKWFGVPFFVGIWGIQYNKEILSKAGYDAPPAQINDFLQCAQDCTVDEDGDGIPETYGFTGVSQPGQSWNPVFYALLKNVGGDYWNGDSSDPKALFNNEYGIRALQVEKALYTSEFSDPVMAAGDPGQSRSSFSAGGVGLSWNYMGWVYADIKNNFPENIDKIGWAPVPVDGDNESYVVTGDMGYVIRDGAQNLDNALAFCLFYSSLPIQKWRNEHDGFAPVRLALANDEEYVAEYPYIPIALDMASRSVRYVEPNMSEIENGSIPIFEKYFNGTIDEQETLDQLEDLFYSTWESYLE